MATRIHNLNYWARAGKTAELAANVRSDLADGATVLVAMPAGDVDGAAWLAEYERQSGDGIPIAVGDRVRVDYCNVSRLNGRIGTVVQVDAKDKVVPYLVTIEGERYVWWCRLVSRIPTEAPIGVGDFVQWDNPHASDGHVWVTGEVTEIGGGIVRVLVASVSPGWRQFGPPRVGKEVGLGYGHGACDTTLRRIPRPAESPSEVTYTEYARVRVQRDGKGGFAVESLARSAVDDLIRRNIEQAQALVGGLTPYECMVRWGYNRVGQERSLAEQCGADLGQHKPMTPDQIAAGKAERARRIGNRHQDELRAKVDASAEAERRRVTYCEVEPWE